MKDKNQPHLKGEQGNQEVTSLLDLKQWVQKVLLPLLKGEQILLLLEGSMGVGKTQLVSMLLNELGSLETCSPTFAIHHRYLVNSQPHFPFKYVDHVDLYRLEDELDLESTGFWDLFMNPSGFVIVEWADRLDDTVWPRHWRKIRIKMGWKHEDELQGARILTWKV